MSFETDIKGLIGFPESNRLKYEALLPSASEIGSIISGFSNTAGGVLILGILNKNRKVTVTGLSHDFNVEVVLDNAVKKLTPTPKFDSGFIDHDGKKLFALKVHKSEKIITYNNVPYTINEKRILKMERNSSTEKSQSEKPINIGYTDTSTVPPQAPASKNIFISYNWGLKATAQKLFNFLTTAGFAVRMDDHNLSYKDHISSFMESIREADFAILIISDQYLKSANCMTEVMHVLKDRDSQKKILPIRHENAKFFQIKDRVAYANYWNSHVKEIEEELKNVEPTSAIEEIKKLRTAKKISQDINDFLSAIGDMITTTIEEQEKNDYTNIVNYIQHH